MKTPEPCLICQRKNPKRDEFWECSHVDCPNRKPVSAQLSDSMLPDNDHNYKSHAPLAE